MTRREFIDTCVRCSYASRKTATEYARDKEVLTEEDFREVFLINERKNDVKNGALNYNKCRLDGNGLINKLNRRPNEWNRTFDASRKLRDDELLDVDK